MSNPAVYLLNEGTINNFKIRIEDNVGEAVHIHIGDIRLSLTTREFYDMCDAIEGAAAELFAIEGLNWNALDLSALDWNWLSEYENFKDFVIEKVRLKDLYTVRHITQNGELQRIVKLKDSLFVHELLNGDGREISLYNENNNYNETPKQRLEKIYDYVKLNDYPYDEKYILVDENKRIYDGDHRAAALYVKHGGEYQIPVVMIIKKGEMESINNLVKYNKKRIAKHTIRQLIRKTIFFIRHPLSISKRTSVCNRKKNEEYGSLLYEDIVNFFEERKISYYVIDQPIINDGEKAIKTIVVSDLPTVALKYKGASVPIYDDFVFLYSTSRPIMLRTNEGNVVVWDGLCCKSKFEKAVLPMDKVINDYAWSAFGKPDKRAQQMITLIYVISNVMLEKESFDKTDIKLIEDNNELLECNEFRAMLEKEFFEYAKKIIKMINQRDYVACVENYIKFEDY